MERKRIRAIAGFTAALAAGAAALAGCAGADDAPRAAEPTTTPRVSRSATAIAASPSPAATATAVTDAPGGPPASAPTQLAAERTEPASIPTAAPTQPAPPPPAPTSTPASQPHAVTVIARGVQFVSSSISTAAGQLTVTLDNQDVRVPHDVAFSAPGGGEVAATSVIAGPGSGSTTFTAWPGTYSFVCTLHPNMTGTLTVQ